MPCVLALKPLLRHAFTGQLVPQDPSDESAAELLKRIAAERAASEGVAAKTKVGRKRVGKKGTGKKGTGA